jgi:hypothetical protein
MTRRYQGFSIRYESSFSHSSLQYHAFLGNPLLWQFRQRAANAHDTKLRTSTTICASRFMKNPFLGGLTGYSFQVTYLNY